MDTDKLKNISEIIRKFEKNELDYQRIHEIIDGISDINSLYLDDNLLKIVCSGIYNHNFSQFELEHRKQLIDIVLKKGIDKNFKFGRYSAPLLFYVENKNIFEYLCNVGFDPNERLTISGYEGRPYFSLHHDFHIDIFQIAQKYGFDKSEMTKDNDEIVHLIFNRFIEFDPEILSKIGLEFKETINIPSNLGLSCFQLYVLQSDVSKFTIDNLKTLISTGFDKNYITQKEIAVSEYSFPKGSSSLDIFNAKCLNYNFDKEIVKEIESILSPNNRKEQKKKWWKF